jgi:choline dehydrogenase-like flavoprotein
VIPTLKYAPGLTGAGSAHVMGGCTMGEDLKHCLTDSDGRYHHLENLYVFDGSVLPTSLGVNPQLTIYGISARNATRLATTLQA